MECPTKPTVFTLRIAAGNRTAFTEKLTKLLGTSRQN